ncbi:MAG: hypothetical protein ACXVYY_07775 [Oryzihumus sp.]
MAQPRAAATSLAVGDVTYAVTHVEQVTGLSDQDLAGMSHGIQGLVDDKLALIRVSLVVSAGSSGSFDPGVLRLRSSATHADIAPVGGSLAPGRLGEGARIEGSVSFVVPRDSAQLTLHVPRVSGQVPLLSVNQAPAGAGTHAHAGPTTTPTTRPTARNN